MNAYARTRAAYSATAAAVRTPVQTEIEALRRLSARMEAADGRGPKGFRELTAALHQNRQLWTIFAADVAEADNPLPADLRARVLYLAEFTRHHSRRVLRGTATAAPLVSLNRMVATGLETAADQK